MNTIETVEEAAERLYPLLNVPDASNVDWGQRLGQRQGFFNGALWQAERMYSEEDIKPLIEFIKDCESNWDCDSDAHKYNTVCRVCKAQKVLEQFKKKIR